ncbi:MAG: hypothetical protein JWM33_2358 [Caulobacteraceae bacterium]|nr:hypothetical protein [Caulobacteraceae bacterium]
MKNAMSGGVRCGLAVVLGLVLGAAAAPDLLPSEVKGVVGSGDQLSLQLHGDAGTERTIRVGEEYRDGWMLQALSPTKATLAKDGATREVGLNPQGAVASAGPAGPPSTVTMTGVPDDETVRAMVAAMGWPPQILAGPLMRGLTDVETRRYTVYELLTQREMQRRVDAARAGGPPVTAGLSKEDIVAILGQTAYEDSRRLADTIIAATQAAVLADLAARPVTGATSYYVPAGGNESQIAAAQGIDRRGIWESGPADAQGGRTYTLTAGTADQYSAALGSGRNLPLPRLPATPPAQTSPAAPPAP